ncbi:MAG TPA: type IV toxin-antitoxin system AbiEi family antitoxin domain-containing protein [Solirubrobacterales bacterium]|nr:type IV toxin-antitoxin system AbiEi family antitoxin domain-containing protein [Solirubrobacterales bacterium]
MAQIAERQHGVVGRSQLLEAGWSEGAIKKRLASGRLHRLHTGVYLVGHRLVQREGRWMAAVLSSGSEAVLSHWSAAALWRLRPTSRSRIDVTAPHRSRSWRHIRRHVSALPSDERTVENGIPVTTVPRTILDLAATEPLEVVRSLIREAEFRELHDSLSLWDLIERYPGRRGIRKVRAALEALRDEPPGEYKSPLEERFAIFLRRHRLPLPVFNAWVTVGEKRFQVDCQWPGTTQIVELDGWQAHKSRSAFHQDRARDRILIAAGYTVTHLTWAQLDDEPEAIASDLRVLLGTDK